MVVIDTNIIIDHLRQKPGTDTLLKKVIRNTSSEIFSISIITIQELFEGKSTENTTVENNLLSTIAPLKILPYTFEIAQKAGEIARGLITPIEFPDVAIAATSIINNANLYTLNKKDFRGIKDLQLL